MKDKNGKELHGAAKYLHQIYTVEGGPKNHDDIQQTKGMMIVFGLILARRALSCLGSKIENLKTKAERMKGEMRC